MGHVILKQGVAFDPSKIKAILEWPVPKDVHDTRSFMGLTGYYHKFIDKFSRIDHAITKLRRKVLNSCGVNNVNIALKN